MIKYRTTEENWKHERVTKWHVTSGQFLRWEVGGVFGFRYAIVQRKRSYLAIPAHDLAKETFDELRGKYPF